MLMPVVPAFIAGYAVNRWKTREDTIEKRCEDVSKEISELTKLASEYWQKDQSAISDQLLGIKILASQTKLSEIRGRLEAFLSVDSAKRIVVRESEFMRSLSGGDFGVHNRTADIERARMLILNAARYESEVRMAHLSDLKGMF